MTAKRPSHTAEATQQTGASYSANRPASPLSAPPTPTEAIGLETPRAEFVWIRPADMPVFRGLFGRLAGVWGVFEVALQVRNLRTLNGVVGRADLFVTKTQVTTLIRNRILV